MNFYRKKSEIWTLFNKSSIHSIIAPFGFSIPYNDWDFEQKARIITRPDEEFVTKTLQYNCEIKTLPRIHIKLAVGNYGLLFGSFNFTTSKKQEIMIFSEKNEDIEDGLNEFEYWWENAKQ